MKLSDKLKQVAEKAQDLIIAELKERGHTTKKGEFRYYDDALDVGGVQVPLRFNEIWVGGTFRKTGQLKLEVNNVSIYEARGNSNKLNRRTFKASAKSRLDTEGFDIPKICDHIEEWVKVYTQVTGTVNAETKSKEQWEQAKEFLQAKYPKACQKVELNVSHKGLRLGGLIGLRDAEKLLAALED